MIYPVILSGGSGSRLWPLSRAIKPKQFLPLVSKRSMLQEALLRLNGLPHRARPIVLCNHHHRFLVAEQLRQIQAEPEVLMLEPVARNTAPAIASAALYVGQIDANAALLVLSSDQVIEEIPTFHECIAQAVHAAKRGRLATFGIVPNKPETGYGYIRRGAAITDLPGLFHVAAFVEKPDLATAQEYCEDGEYFWNSGMFVFPVKELLQELEQHQPEMLQRCREALKQASRDSDYLRLEEKAFAATPSISIDHAVMEKTDRAVVAAADMGWSDVGSWSALWEELPKDESGNVRRGEVLQFETRDSYVHSTGRLVATIGVENLVVVETEDAVLVARKDKSQDVKRIVEWLQQENETKIEDAARR